MARDRYCFYVSNVIFIINIVAVFQKLNVSFLMNIKQAFQANLVVFITFRALVAKQRISHRRCCYIFTVVYKNVSYHGYSPCQNRRFLLVELGQDLKGHLTVEVDSMFHFLDHPKLVKYCIPVKLTQIIKRYPLFVQQGVLFEKNGGTVVWFIRSPCLHLETYRSIICEHGGSVRKRVSLQQPVFLSTKQKYIFVKAIIRFGSENVVYHLAKFGFK